MNLSCEYTFPGGLPIISEQIASLAHLILLNDPRIWIFLSATTILVLDAFSIANLVLPFSPVILPIARERLSPVRFFTNRRSIKKKNEFFKAILVFLLINYHP